MKIIKGNTSPKAEEKTFYELSILVPDFSNPIFNNKPKEKYICTLFKKDKATGWKQVSKNIKYGKKVPYTFGEKVVGIPYRIEVHTETKNLLNVTEKKFVANLIVTPRTAKESVIGRVILLNRGNIDVNKAKFSESLSAEARTSNLFAKEITFYLWEEGVSEADKYKKPKKAFVDKNGIAKVTFSLSEYATPKTLMSFFTGDENTTKKFFVSAVYENKKVTNKTPVVASDGTTQPASTSASNSNNRGSGIISRLTEIVAEGMESITSNNQENTRSATSVEQIQPAKSNTENKCPNCSKDITVEELKKIFSDASDTTLKEAATAYNKYMKNLNMNTCWNKAHFFAQASIEVGSSFTLKQGESLNYSARRLKDGDYVSGSGWIKDLKNGGHYTSGKWKTGPFSYFKSHQDDADKYGRKDLNKYGDGGIQKANYEMIASLVYDDENRSSKEKLGNTQAGDGWKFRGRGLVQLTGRSNYNAVNKYTLKEENIDILLNPDKVNEVKIAVLTSMGYWKNHGGDTKSNGQKDEDILSRLVGSDVDYAGKKRNFDNITSKVFKINECKLTKTQKAESRSEKKGKYDIEKAVAHLDSNALPKSKGKCALYVRQAINAGGIYHLSGHATEYYDTDKLSKYGFTKIGSDLDLNSVSLKKGDIATFSSVKGHPYGHIAMWNGKQWVSDFKQKSFWVATQYSIDKKYAIYRWVE